MREQGDKTRLSNSQIKVMRLVWEGEPITAKEVAVRAAGCYDWNKNTTYTILKSLVEKGSVNRTEPDFVCTSAVTLDEVRRTATHGLIEKLYRGSSSAFFSAFLEDEKLSREELESLRRLIDEKK